MLGGCLSLGPGLPAGRIRGHEIMMRPRRVIKSHGDIDLLRFLREPRAHGATLSLTSCRPSLIGPLGIAGAVEPHLWPRDSQGSSQTGFRGCAKQAAWAWGRGAAAVLSPGKAGASHCVKDTGAHSARAQRSTFSPPGPRDTPGGESEMPWGRVACLGSGHVRLCPSGPQCLPEMFQSRST